MDYWVINENGYDSKITENATTVTFENGLIKRTVIKENCGTVSFKSENGNELISGVRPDFCVCVNGKTISAGDNFAFSEMKLVPCQNRIEFIRTDTMTSKCDFPPKGKAACLTYVSADNLLTVTVRYEIYDGMPVIMKCVTVENDGEGAITIENISTDVLEIKENRDTLFVDSDFDSTTDFSGLDLSSYAKNYARYSFDVLDVSPKYRMNVELSPKESVNSIIAFELLFQSEYYENRLIEVKEMYRRVAPWCTDNVMFFHLISNSSAAIRNAVRECRETGLEMIIQSFGSGVRMESHSERYLSRIKKAYDYGHENGIRMGAYTLAYVKNYRAVRGDEALNHDKRHICRCLATDWSQKYTKSILNFIDKTGADAVEIDGPYGMMLCSGGKTHNHADFTDSQYKQWKAAVSDWYKELKKRSVYINAPDWHYLNGTNRNGVGYEEIAFSEKREEQLITSRIYYYKGTFTKNPSQCWGFLPLNVYHGGGSDAQFFPTEKNSFEFDWALAQLTASGVWPTIRGKKVYDSETGKKILKKWASIFKKYRNILNGITVHFMPPEIDTENPSRTKCIDAIMNQLPYGDDRGFLMFFNQTDKEQSQKVTVPVYYTGLSGLKAPPAPFPNTKNCDVIYPLYGSEREPLMITARDGKKRDFITDKKFADKEIPHLASPELTDRTIVVSCEDSSPETYKIDSNGNITMNITLPPMSYRWYVFHEKKL